MHFGGNLSLSVGLPWYEYSMFSGDGSARRSRSPSPSSPPTTTSCSTAAARCSTASAPIIKLPADATEDDHLALLGLLNSSTACFWMKQVFHNKGTQWNRGGIRATRPGRTSIEFDGTRALQSFPIPDVPHRDPAPGPRAGSLPSSQSPEPRRDRQARVPDGRALVANRIETERLQAPDDLASGGTRLACYRLYGLIGRKTELDWEIDGLYSLWRLGERAFEIVLARKMAAGEERRPGSSGTARRRSPRSPTDWPESYRDVVAPADRADRDRPEHRPDRAARVQAALESASRGRTQVQRALRAWLLDRLEIRPLLARPGDASPS